MNKAVKAKSIPAMVPGRTVDKSPPVTVPAIHDPYASKAIYSMHLL